MYRVRPRSAPASFINPHTPNGWLSLIRIHPNGWLSLIRSRGSGRSLRWSAHHPSTTRVIQRHANKRWWISRRDGWPTTLRVFDDFTVRVPALLALEGASVVIWFIRFKANKPHQGGTVGTFWLAENQSRWVKRLEIRHGCTTKRSGKRIHNCAK